MINPHYLELFYYLALHGGVSEAARKMPYGVQPCTVSRQIAELEKVLGAQLYERRPFQLSPAGEQLFRAIRPFFEQVERLGEQFRAGLQDAVRLATSSVAFQDCFPPLLCSMRRSFPQLRFTLKEGMHWQIKQWFETRTVDLAITMIEGTPPKDCCWETLLRLQFALLVNKRSSVQCADELFCPGCQEQILISPWPDDDINQCFRQGLLARGVDWQIGIQTNSIDLVEVYVQEGFGIGLSVAVPGRTAPAGLRVLPLDGFPSVSMGLVWRRNPNKVTQALIEQLRQALSRAAPSLPLRPAA